MVSGSELTSERFRTLTHGNRGSQVIQWTLVAQATSLVVFVLLASYWDFPLTEALSFPVADGWCDVRNEGVSSHCFGDFGYELANARRADPWASGLNPYPPSVQMVFDWFRALADLLGYNQSFALYVGTLLLATGVATGLLARSASRAGMSGVTIVPCVLLGWGFISALDRGNNVLWLLPMTVIVMRHDNTRTRTFWWCVLALALLKPQFMILGALLGLVRFICLLVTFLGMQLASTAWLMGASGAVRGMRSWVSAVLAHDEYPIGLGQNMSLRGPLSLFTSAPVGFALAAVFMLVALVQARPDPSDSEIPTVVVGLGLVTSVMTPTVVFPYYSVVFQFVVLSLIVGPAARRKYRLSQRFSLVALFVLSSVTLIDPGSNRHLSVALVPLASLAVIILSLAAWIKDSRVWEHKGTAA